MKKTAIFVIVWLALLVPGGAQADSTVFETELAQLGSGLLENTNALVNLSKDLVEVAKSCPDQEMLYVYSLAEKLGNVLVICFYEGRFLKLVDMIRPDEKLAFFKMIQESLEQRALPRIEANLSAVQAGSTKVRNAAALHMLDNAQMNVRQSLELMRRCVGVLNRLIDGTAQAPTS
jgi:hypothetical protein